MTDAAAEKTARTVVTVARLKDTGAPVNAQVGRWIASGDENSDGGEWREEMPPLIIPEGGELRIYLDAAESVKVWEGALEA